MNQEMFPVAGEGAVQGAPASEKARPALPRRVLLIESDLEFAGALALAMEEHDDCSVLCAADSYEAGNMMAHHAFDLVVTDWELPFLNGFSSLRQAEHGLDIDPAAPGDWFGGARVPVVVLTASDSPKPGEERKLRGHFRFLGVVSKGQPTDAILEQLEILYGNFRPHAPPAPSPARGRSY